MIKKKKYVLTLSGVKIFFYIFCFISSIQCFGGDLPEAGSNRYEKDSLPPVFMIGQFTDPFEALNNSSQTLLEVCQNDVYLAYDKWLHMLSELESVSESLGLSLKGTKYWFSIFWNQDGTIKHFAYFPKSGSKEIDSKLFKEVLTVFISQYKLPVASNKNSFYNYGSGAFPLPDRKPTARR